VRSVACQACHCSSLVPLFPRLARRGRHATVLALTAFSARTTNNGPIDHQSSFRAGASSFACTASLLGAHLWSSFRASSVLAPHPSLNLPPLLGSPYRTPSVPSSVTTRSRCVFVRCATSYLPVLILPTFSATFIALPSSLDQRFVPTSSIPISSQFIINRSATAPPQFIAAKLSRTHHWRASGPRWRDRQTCPHSRQTDGPVEVSAHRLPTVFGCG